MIRTKILLIYPQYPDSFWSYKYALKYVGAKAANPPLGLLTIAAMLPPEWDKKLIDMNVNPLLDKDIQWADLVMVSAMSIQRQSTMEVVKHCQDLGVKIAAGGPLFTSEPDAISEVDYLILNEGEVTLPPFLKDLTQGKPQHIYTSDKLPDLSETPVPLWDLVNVRDYATISIQYSRGCPYDCEFCEITSLFGHKPRLKSSAQMLKELDRQIKFIQESGIVTAMVGMLHAPVGTKLFQRLKEEHRLFDEKFSGNNTDYSLNFITKMNVQTLKEGYQRIVRTVYEPSNYYLRVFQFFKEYRPVRMKGFNKVRFRHIRALVMSIFDLGIKDKDRKLYWKFIFKTMANYPQFLPEAINFAVYGIHFRKVFSAAPAPEAE